ncbi:MAG: hypothetical protein ISR02_05640 [Flavobacteriales bacterium]|jgi:hypothetical protein|nr:hypothetical protein [Flavobacteriales bacterium]|tara:strand:- start:249 stop:866 length:618 start_codon:yes stop_codon:yes gene_type:complete
MDERINLLLSYEENYFNEKEITPFSDRLDTELNQIKNHLDKIRFLKLLQLSIEEHILKIGERPVNVKQLGKNQFEEEEFNKRKKYVEIVLNRLDILLGNQVVPQDANVTPDLNTVQNRTKILLLEELGVLDFLKKKEPFKNSTNLAKLIAELISGKNDDVNAVYNSIRTDLSYVNQKKNPKSPYTKPQIKIVNSILTSFSLPLIK